MYENTKKGKKKDQRTTLQDGTEKILKLCVKSQKYLL